MYMGEKGEPNNWLNPEVSVNNVQIWLIYRSYDCREFHYHDDMHRYVNKTHDIISACKKICVLGSFSVS